ncbi:hypothetical protein HY439_03000 [Candidatus Microgenomates bacterium]|nr:hypothetical protein [Candidatus Microgenomates bacterium]
MSIKIERANLAPQIAYDLEAQAITIQWALTEGELVKIARFLERVELIEELGLEWYRLYYKSDQGDSVATVCKEHVDQAVLDEMNTGDTMTFIQTRERKPEVFDGRELCAVAAILSGEQL